MSKDLLKGLVCPIIEDFFYDLYKEIKEEIKEIPDTEESPLMRKINIISSFSLFKNDRANNQIIKIYKNLCE